LLLRALILLGLGAVVVSWYAHATRAYVEVRVTSEHVDSSVLINCVPFVSQPGVEETFDLGWLRPQNVVSIEFLSGARSDGTLRKGYFQVERRIDHGKWQTLKVFGTSGLSVDLPPYYKRAFIADGTNLGEREGCTSPPLWGFARSQLKRTQTPATRRDALAFDVATSVGPWLLRAMALIAAIVFGLAYFGRERLAVPARRVVEGALAVPLALATFHVALAIAASAAVVAAAWYEHSRGGGAGAVGGDDVADGRARPDSRQAQ